MAVTMTTTIPPNIADTYLARDDPAKNFGSTNIIQHGAYTGSIIRRSLVKFDLSTIPSTELCDSAILSVWLAQDLADTDCTFSIHRVLKNWVEAEATWYIYSTGNNWPLNGAFAAGGVDLTPMGTSALIAANAALNTEIQISLDTTEMKKMYDGTYTNYGWLIKSTNETESDVWGVYSREYGSGASGYNPKLVIETHAGVIPGVIWF